MRQRIAKQSAASSVARAKSSAAPVPKSEAAPEDTKPWFALDQQPPAQDRDGSTGGAEVERDLSSDACSDVENGDWGECSEPPASRSPTESSLDGDDWSESEELPGTPLLPESSSKVFLRACRLPPKVSAAGAGRQLSSSAAEPAPRGQGAGRQRSSSAAEPHDATMQAEVIDLEEAVPLTPHEVQLADYVSRTQDGLIRLAQSDLGKLSDDAVFQNTLRVFHVFSPNDIGSHTQMWNKHKGRERAWLAELLERHVHSHPHLGRQGSESVPQRAIFVDSQTTRHVFVRDVSVASSVECGGGPSTVDLHMLGAGFSEEIVHVALGMLSSGEAPVGFERAAEPTTGQVYFFRRATGERFWANSEEWLQVLLSAASAVPQSAPPLHSSESAGCLQPVLPSVPRAVRQLPLPVSLGFVAKAFQFLLLAAVLLDFLARWVQAFGSVRGRVRDCEQHFMENRCDNPLPALMDRCREWLRCSEVTVLEVALPTGALRWLAESFVEALPAPSFLGLGLVVLLCLLLVSLPVLPVLPARLPLAKFSRCKHFWLWAFGVVAIACAVLSAAPAPRAQLHMIKAPSVDDDAIYISGRLRRSGVGVRLPILVDTGAIPSCPSHR